MSGDLPTPHLHSVVIYLLQGMTFLLPFTMDGDLPSPQPPGGGDLPTLVVIYVAPTPWDGDLHIYQGGNLPT